MITGRALRIALDRGGRGMRERARLAGIEHDRKITKETDSQFLFEYQRAIRCR